jgi:Spy/CpxP family protein refolding chaperone
MLKQSWLAAGLGVVLAASLARAQPGPGGFPGGPGGGPSKPGQVLPGSVQDRLKLTDEQKKQIEDLQKEVDARLGKILTPDQKKSLDDMGNNPFGGGFGPGGGPPGGFPGGFGPGGGFGGPGRLSTDDVKKKINATEEEWKVISPKLQKVVNARQVVTSSGSTGAFGGFGFGPPGGQPGTNIITQAEAEFRAVLDDPKHTKEELKVKADAVREARQKARGELQTAEKDLISLLTKDQEEVLTGLGYLE